MTKYAEDTLRKDALCCRECALHESRNKVVWGDGPLRSDILIVGEAPGFLENKQGVPFVGRSGKLLRNTLSSVGIILPESFIINCIMCRPPKNRDPKPEELAACDKWFQEKIAWGSPKMIITPGKFSTAKVLGIPLKDVKITKLSGKQLKSVWEIPVFPLVHPSYVLRGGMTKADYMIDAAYAAAYAYKNRLKGVIGGQEKTT